MAKKEDENTGADDTGQPQSGPEISRSFVKSLPTRRLRDETPDSEPRSLLSVGAEPTNISDEGYGDDETDTMTPDHLENNGAD